MFSVVGVFAEFERGMLQQRVRSGIDRARAQGVPCCRAIMGTNTIYAAFFLYGPRFSANAILTVEGQRILHGFVLATAALP
jgi:hypothetical protein